MAYVIIPRHDTIAALSTLNRIYAEGELILEEQLDGTYKLKVGNGVQTYNLLAYIGGVGGGGSNAFGSIVVSGQSTIAADTISDTLTVAVGAGLTATTNATTDTLTLSPLYGTTAGTICQGDDSRIGTGTPTAHAASHTSGGSDPIKLDALAAPDDVTTRNASTSAHGLLPKLNGSTSSYLNGNGAWTTPPGVAVPFVGVRATGGDDTAAIQAAVNSLSTTGGVVQLWPEFYRISGTVSVPYAVIIQGSGFQEGPQTLAPARPSRGTWIWHDSTTVYAFDFSTMATGQNAGMRDLAFWETHPDPGVGWTPTTRNFCVYVSLAADRVEFRNVHFHNIYKAIDCFNAGRLILNHVTGQIFHTGVRHDRGYDMPRYDNIHFWPYWSAHAAVLQWSQNNGSAFRIGRVDGLFMDHIFTFGFQNAFHLFSPTSDGGSATKVYIGNFYGDVTGRMMTIDQSNASVHCNQATHQGLIWYNDGGAAVVAQPNSAGIVINGSNCYVAFGHLRVDEVIGHAVNVLGTNNVVWIGSADFRRWNLTQSTRIGAIAITSNTSSVSMASEPYLLRDNAGDPLVEASSGGVLLKSLAQNFVSNMVNEIRASGNIAGQPPLFVSIGSDTNIDLLLAPKGTGNVRFGTRVAQADVAITGYIEIKDSAGTLRRLAVIG